MYRKYTDPIKFTTNPDSSFDHLSQWNKEIYDELHTYLTSIKWKEKGMNIEDLLSSNYSENRADILTKYLTKKYTKQTPLFINKDKFFYSILADIVPIVDDYYYITITVTDNKSSIYEYYFVCDQLDGLKLLLSYKEMSKLLFAYHKYDRYKSKKKSRNDNLHANLLILDEYDDYLDYDDYF